MSAIGQRTLSALALEWLAMLPPVLQKDPWVHGILNAQANEHERLNLIAERVAEGLIPTQANELTLPLWEGLLGLPVSPPETTIDARRSLVMSRILRGDGSGTEWERAMGRATNDSYKYSEHEPLATPNHPVVAARSGTNVLVTSNGGTVDGVSYGQGTRLLLTNQANPVNNGVWAVMGPGGMGRVSDMDTWDELVGAVVRVAGGTSFGGTVWRSMAPPGGTLGTTPVTWVQVKDPAAYTLDITTALPPGMTLAGLTEYVRRITPANLHTNILGGQTYQQLADRHASYAAARDAYPNYENMRFGSA